MSSGASVNALQCLVEQLKLEAGVERIRVSQAAAELQQYCVQNACKDGLAGRGAGWEQPLPGAQILCFTLKIGKKFIEECLQVQSDERLSMFQENFSLAKQLLDSSDLSCALVL